MPLVYHTLALDAALVGGVLAWDVAVLWVILRWFRRQGIDRPPRAPKVRRWRRRGRVWERPDDVVHRHRDGGVW